MTFDPDKFLAEPEQETTSFDPEAFIADEPVEDKGPSTLEKIGSTAQDALIAAGDTGLGHLAAGASRAVASISPIDKLLSYVSQSPEQRAMEEEAKKIFEEADKKPLKVTIPETTLGEEFEGGRETLKTAIAHAKERSPVSANIASLGANIAEGVVGGKALGTAVKASSGLSKAAKVGSGITDRLSILKTPAELAAIAGIEGGLVEAAKGGDFEEGAKMGAVAGGVLGAGVPAVMGLAKFTGGMFKNLFEGKAGDQIRKLYQQGTEGVDPFAKGYVKDVARESEKIGRESIEKITKTRKNVGENLAKLRKENLGSETVDLEGRITGMIDELEVRRANTLSEGGKEHQSIDTLQSYLEDLNSKTDLRAIPVDRLNKLSAELTDLVTDFTSPTRIKDLDIAARAREFSQELTGDIDEIIKANLSKVDPKLAQQLDEAKESFGKLADLEIRLGLRGKKGPKFSKADIDKKVEQFSSKFTKDKSIEDVTKTEGFYDDMRAAGFGDTEIKTLQDNLDSVATEFDIYKTLNPSENVNVFSRIIRNLQTEIPLKAGQVAKSVQTKVTGPMKKNVQDMKSLLGKIKKSKTSQTIQSGVGVSTKWLRNASPEKLVEVADQLPEQLGRQLKKISEQPDVTKRAAYIHALSQQPAFRSIMKDLVGDDEE